MLFAAGKGTRLGDLTKARPKPLIRVGGRALVDRALDIAAAAGVETRVANAHHLADMLIAHMSSHPDVLVSHEHPRLLDTGGGLRNALPLLGSEPVYTLNTDCVWKGPNPLLCLAEAWDCGIMGALLLLAPLHRAQVQHANGDFVFTAERRIRRRRCGETGYIYTGAQILETSLLAEFDEEAFSLNRVWDRLIARGRLFGISYPGIWADAGSPDGLLRAEALAARADGQRA